MALFHTDSIGLAPRFADRTAAGAMLAEQLAGYRGQHPLVLGIPRGGVPVAAEVASRLGGELDVLVARKLGAPFSEELAIGAVTADGGRYLNAPLIRELQVSEAYLDQVTAAQMEEARRRETRFRAGDAAPKVEGRVVILVDDGLATGATMRAAVSSLRLRRPKWIIVAVPVGSREACAALRAEADELVCPFEPDPFIAVGQFYRDFEQTEDAEVMRLLRREPV